jgi:hypothetical protein
MYAWIDGIHVRVRLDEDKLCLLVVVGMRADGTKELVTLADGHRESACAWADMLGDCAAVTCPLQYPRWGAVRWGSGRRSGRCPQTPARSRPGRRIATGNRHD